MISSCFCSLCNSLSLRNKTASGGGCFMPMPGPIPMEAADPGGGPFIKALAKSFWPLPPPFIATSSCLRSRPPLGMPCTTWPTLAETAATASRSLSIFCVLDISSLPLLGSSSFLFSPPICVLSLSPSISLADFICICCGCC